MHEAAVVRWNMPPADARWDVALRRWSMSLPPRPHELVPRRGFESSFEGVYQQLTWADEFDDCFVEYRKV